MVDQSTFGTALLDPETPHPPSLKDAEGRPAGRRFDVYRNNVAVSLTDALATGFPVIAKLLGDEFFKAMAGVFLRSYPPGDPRLQLWGAKFPGFLARFEPVAHLPYLPDMARLELGLRQSYHAADVTPIQLADRDPSEVLTLKPRLAPATMILRSRFPILTIWQKNSGQPDLTIEWHPETVLITRPAFDPQVHLLPRGGHTLARHLKGRLTLTEAVTATQTIDTDAEASAILTLFLSSGALTLDPPASEGL